MTPTIVKMASPFSLLKKRLWFGTWVTNALFLLTVASLYPSLFRYALMGVAMGTFYLWSLMFSADYPKRGIQFVFSLIRVACLAYLIVELSGNRIPELTVVICGLLSYKVMLTVEYVVQALPAFRKQVKHTPFSSALDVNP